MNYLMWIKLITIISFVNVIESMKHPDYTYKNYKTNEVRFREFESACEQTPNCLNKIGADKIRCVRECISPSCYSSLYKKDELEEGEIDTRLTSFIGCFVEKSLGRINPR